MIYLHGRTSPGSNSTMSIRCYKNHIRLNFWSALLQDKDAWDKDLPEVYCFFSYCIGWTGSACVG